MPASTAPIDRSQRAHADTTGQPSPRQGSALPAVTGHTADNAARFAQLQRFYVQAQRYGKGGIRELDNGRYRFYGQVTAARSSGEMVGRRLVREWDPGSDTTRIWHETLDSSGRVRIVRPDVQHTGGKKVHYMFDASGTFVGVF